MVYLKLFFPPANTLIGCDTHSHTSKHVQLQHCRQKKMLQITFLSLLTVNEKENIAKFAILHESLKFYI
jgi:hypothetical protein